jgi:phosphatidate cytidylyltransferase
MASELPRRLAVAAIGIPIVVIVAWLGGVVMAVGLGLLAAGGVWEFGRMFTTRGDRFLIRTAVVGAAALPFVVWSTGPAGAALFLTVQLLAVTAIAALRIPPEDGPFRVAALSFGACVYVGGLLSYAMLLRETLTVDQRLGTALFLLPVGITWLADTAAYFAGRALGRRPLAPIISPNKTMEGGFAGLLAGPIAALFLARMAIPEFFALGSVQVALVGLLIAVAAILGDLVESAIKRECGVKDSGGLLPGHGGLLDRMDSLLWAIPVAYLSLRVLL